MGGWEGVTTSQDGGEVGIPLVELCNTKFLFHVFLKILIPYARCSRIAWTDPEHLPARALLSKISIGEILVG